MNTRTTPISIPIRKPNLTAIQRATRIGIDCTTPIRIATGNTIRIRSPMPTLTRCWIDYMRPMEIGIASTRMRDCWTASKNPILTLTHSSTGCTTRMVRSIAKSKVKLIEIGNSIVKSNPIRIGTPTAIPKAIVSRMPTQIGTHSGIVTMRRIETMRATPTLIWIETARATRIAIERRIQRQREIANRTRIPMAIQRVMSWQIRKSLRNPIAIQSNSRRLKPTRTDWSSQKSKTTDSRRPRPTRLPTQTRMETPIGSRTD